MTGDRVTVAHAELRDEAGKAFTGPLLRTDGRLGIFIRGRGFFAGPLSPDQLRGFAHSFLRIADEIETRAELAGEAVLTELASIVAEGSA